MSGQKTPLCSTRAGADWTDAGTLTRTRSDDPRLLGEAPTHFASHDLHFLVVDRTTGRPLGDTPYRITLETGERLTGRTDHLGATRRIQAGGPLLATLEIPYHGNRPGSPDADGESDPCHR